MRRQLALIAIVVIPGIVVSLRTLAQEPKADSALKPLVTHHGRLSKVVEPRIVRITNDREWQALWREHNVGKSKDAPDEYARMEFDFDRVMVIAVFQGEGILCGGYDVDSIAEAKDRLRLRVRPLYYQLAGRPGDEKLLGSSGWGVFVIPRSNKKIVLEKDVKGMVTDPPKWKKWTTLPAIEPTRGR